MGEWEWHIKQNMFTCFYPLQPYHHLNFTTHNTTLFLLHFSSHFSTSEFRSAFLKTIRQIIRESVRNMALPSLDSLRKPEPPQRSESTKLSSQLSTDSRSPIGESGVFQEANFATRQPHPTEILGDC